MRLTDKDRADLLERIYSGLAARGAPARKSDFMDNLCLRAAKRATDPPPGPEGEEPAEEPEGPPEPRGATFLDEAGAGAVDDLIEVRLGEYFPLIEKVVLERDDESFQEILRRLEAKLKIRGILYRRGLDPEREYPGLWSKIWEALPKWDGRDFRAYVARLVRNYCIDDLKRRKKSPHEIPDEAADVRPTFKTESKASTRDSLEHVLSVIEELESEGDLAPIDGVIFAMLTSGRVVQDIAAAFTGPVIEPFAKAVRALVGKKKLEARPALAIRYVLDGLEPDEVAVLTGLPATTLGSVGRALREVKGASPEEEGEGLLLARSLAREGVSAQDVERAAALTTNAINLRINRARLKVWMALCDRAHDSLRRRGSVDEVDLAIVQHRCTVDTGAWCRMYKDRTCKRERSPAEIARKAGLNLTGDQMAKRVDEFREKILDGLGRAFPDYNSCLTERKPDRGKS
jgi:hypothetical protein